MIKEVTKGLPHGRRTDIGGLEFTHEEVMDFLFRRGYRVFKNVPVYKWRNGTGTSIANAVIAIKTDQIPEIIDATKWNTIMVTDHPDHYEKVFKGEMRKKLLL